MRIAFDLDDTLIPTRPDVPRERGTVYAVVGLLFRERLRRGTCQLLRQLKGEGHDVWLYTTSLRSPLTLTVWFRCLGIALGGVINQTKHNERMKTLPGPVHGTSKYPPAFAIDWLVDDSIGVEEEGRRHGFSVIHVQPDDLHWVATVRQALASADVPNWPRFIDPIATRSRRVWGMPRHYPMLSHLPDE
jgi:hypothetical protein